MVELLGFVLCLSLLLYLGTLAVAGQIKANAVLSWEWKQLKRFFKWIMKLITDFIIWICKAIQKAL